VPGQPQPVQHRPPLACCSSHRHTDRWVNMR
jgi:hypothetical protein